MLQIFYGLHETIAICFKILISKNLSLYILQKTTIFIDRQNMYNNQMQSIFNKNRYMIDKALFVVRYILENLVHQFNTWFHFFASLSKVWYKCKQDGTL